MSSIGEPGDVIVRSNSIENTWKVYRDRVGAINEADHMRWRQPSPVRSNSLLRSLPPETGVFGLGASPPEPMPGAGDDEGTSPPMPMPGISRMRG